MSEAAAASAESAWRCEAHGIVTTGDCPRCDDELIALHDEPRNGEVVHDRDCGVPTGRTWACSCSERNGYRVTSPGDEATS